MQSQLLNMLNFHVNSTKLIPSHKKVYKMRKASSFSFLTCINIKPLIQLVSKSGVEYNFCMQLVYPLALITNILFLPPIDMKMHRQHVIFKHQIKFRYPSCLITWKINMERLWLKRKVELYKIDMTLDNFTKKVGNVSINTCQVKCFANLLTLSYVLILDFFEYLSQKQWFKINQIFYFFFFFHWQGPIKPIQFNHWNYPILCNVSNIIGLERSGSSTTWLHCKLDLWSDRCGVYRA